MAKTLTPAEITAAAEAEQAEQHAAELRAAVENGDATITPAALAEAEQKGKFARLRIKAAEKKAAAQAEADRHKRADQVAAAARTLAEQDDSADLAAKMRTAVDALAAVHAAATNRHDRISDMVNRTTVIRNEAEQAGVPDPRARYGVGLTPMVGETGLIVGKTDPIAVRSVSPEDAVAAVVALAVPSGNATMATRAAKVCRNVPAVGDVFTQPAGRAA
ncbi:hypothetical protein [Streptomyces sp. NPDC059906]|uniref:hypothetical protein n=1 Tax=Streptomyces sp. NPDC059906 TaxID=3346997 RepID=UPI0036677B8D